MVQAEVRWAWKASHSACGCERRISSLPAFLQWHKYRPGNKGCQVSHHLIMNSKAVRTKSRRFGLAALPRHDHYFKIRLRLPQDKCSNHSYSLEVEAHLSPIALMHNSVAKNTRRAEATSSIGTLCNETKRVIYWLWTVIPSHELLQDMD